MHACACSVNTRTSKVERESVKDVIECSLPTGPEQFAATSGSTGCGIPMGPVAPVAPVLPLCPVAPVHRCITQAYIDMMKLQPYASILWRALT